MDTAASTRRKPAKSMQPDFATADDLSWWRTVPPMNVPPAIYGRILGVVCARLERMEFGGNTAGFNSVAPQALMLWMLRSSWLRRLQGATRFWRSRVPTTAWGRVLCHSQA